MTERDQLRERFSRLGYALTDTRSDRIDPAERALLGVQFSVMNAYLQILEIRIAKLRP